MKASAKRREHMKLGGVLIAIIVFKYLKAAAFTALGVAALHLARIPRDSLQSHLIHLMGASGRTIMLRHVAEIIERLSKGQVQAIGAGAILIALVFAAEGTALLMRKPWAPLFTITLTALGIPAEVVEIVRQPTSPRRYVLLAINAAILYYLWTRKDEFRHVEKAARKGHARRVRVG
jgi:uncharacterized membrane protein (DUF2068 family)